MRLRDVRLDMVVPRGGASCVQVTRLLQRYLDGDLDEATRARIAGHLAECRRCGLEEETYRAIAAALARRGRELPAEPLARLHAFAADLAAEGDPDA